MRTDKDYWQLVIGDSWDDKRVDEVWAVDPEEAAALLIESVIDSKHKLSHVDGAPVVAKKSDGTEEHFRVTVEAIVSYKTRVRRVGQ